MCVCQEIKGSPLWGVRCKCSHAVVVQTGERIVKSAMVRSWECRSRSNCTKTWEVNIGFSSQDQLEGKV